MSLPKSVEEIITQHVLFEIEAIDRMYFNLYMDRVQSEGGTATFFINHRKEACATALMMSLMTRTFLKKIEDFAQKHSFEIISFEKHTRNDDQ